jgi:Metal-dependent hydrolase
MARPRSRLTRFAVLCLTGALALWAAEWGVAEAHPGAMLLAAAPQATFALPSLVTLLLAGLHRNRAAALWSLGALALCLGPLMGLRVPAPRPPVPPDAPPLLRVMTFNVEKWSHGVPAVARAIEAVGPDVVSLQEAGRYHWLTGPEHNPDALARALPAYRFRRDGEIMVGSRLPVRAFRAHPLPPGPVERPALEAVVEWQGRPVRVVSVHLIPIQFGEVLGDFRRGSLRHSRAVTAERLAQRDALLAAVTEEGEDAAPLILGGDFNAQPQSRLSRRLAGRWDNAFDRAGAGYGYTTLPSAVLPTARFDHVFVSRSLDVRRCWVPNVRASDHRPVVADIAVPPAEKERESW